MNMTITNLPSPILHLILNDESLARVSDFKAIREVCRCFNDHKTVQKLRANHTGTNTIFSLVHDKKVECLALRGDLAGMTVPGLLPALLKELDLMWTKNIPTELINRALGSSTIEILDLTFCDLYETSVPTSLPVSLKALNLYHAINIPPELIDLALHSSTIEILDLRTCYLDEISVPESLPASLKELYLYDVDNIELINRALHSSTIVNLYLSGCDLAEITVPESLPTSLKELDLSRAKNIPTELITKARARPNCDVVLTN